MLFEGYKRIDLSHTIHSDVPTWEGSCGFHLKMLHDYAECQTETKFRGQAVEMLAGLATHMDAPAHCIPGGKCIDQIPLTDLLAPAIVIDISQKAGSQYRLSTQDVADFEAQQGTIPDRSLVIVYTGWSRFWKDPERYRNPDEFGKMRFPSVSIEAAQVLLARNIVGLAIDTLSPDAPNNSYPVHSLMLGAGKFIIENVANANHMPPRGGYVIALPLKMSQATESPIRLIGLYVNET